MSVLSAHAHIEDQRQILIIFTSNHNMHILGFKFYVYQQTRFCSALPNIIAVIVSWFST